LVINEITAEQNKELDALFDTKTPNTTTPITVDNNKQNTANIDTSPVPPPANTQTTEEKKQSEVPTSN